MITDQMVDESLAFMDRYASKYAHAKANRRYLEEYRKSLKGLLYAEAPEGTIQARESYAYAHDRYLANLEGLKAAVEEEETLLWKLRAAQISCEIYRTQQANNRVIVNSAA